MKTIYPSEKQLEQKERIVLYQPDETIRIEIMVENDTVSLEVRMGDETVWLTQGQIIELFQSSKANISEHIKNIMSREN